MKVAVLSGSPHGQYSITLQSVLYLQKKFPDDHFDIVPVGAKIRTFEKDITPLLEKMQSADLVLFVYPVYIFLVPSQLHRAIELIKSVAGDILKGKPVAQITTSKHFYDTTAQKFIEENVNDLGMFYVKGLYEDMDDLLTKKGQKELTSFWNYIRFRVQSHALVHSDVQVPKKAYDIVVVSDAHPGTKLEKMVEEFRKVCPSPAVVRVVNIADFKFQGGCLGCFKCATDGNCFYKDGFQDFLRKDIGGADAILYAFKIQDHSMGSNFKKYDDRQFCNGHRMTNIGKPVAYLIEGDIYAEQNLLTIIEARAEMGHNFLCQIVTDRSDEGAMTKMAQELIFTLEEKTSLPPNFYGVGGTKIFRDLIWVMRGLMKADHRFYKEHGVYDDLPQRHIGKMLQMKLLGAMFSNKRIQNKMGNRMNEGMVMPYKKLIDSLDK